MEVYVHYTVRGRLIFMHVRNIAKGTISFVMSVCQSVRPSVRPHGTTGCNCTDFHEVWYLSIFRIYVEKI